MYIDRFIGKEVDEVQVCMQAVILHTAPDGGDAGSGSGGYTHVPAVHLTESPTSMHTAQDSLARHDADDDGFPPGKRRGLLTGAHA